MLGQDGLREPRSSSGGPGEAEKPCVKQERCISAGHVAPCQQSPTPAPTWVKHHCLILEHPRAVSACITGAVSSPNTPLLQTRGGEEKGLTPQPSPCTGASPRIPSLSGWGEEE